jgi:hypothetical protein
VGRGYSRLCVYVCKVDDWLASPVYVSVLSASERSKIEL